MLVLYAGFVDEHDWDVVANRIDPLALDTLQPAVVGLQIKRCLAKRANKNFRQILTDGHRRISSLSRMKGSYFANSARALETTSRNWRERSSKTSYLPSPMVFASINSLPTATAAEPALRKSAAVSRFTPPVGIISICGNG